MKHHRIPGTELKLSALCLGTSAFGTRLKGEEADRVVGTFLEAGGTFFDTAHCYSFWEPNGLGASERELGACLRRLGVLDKVVIGTKGGHPDGGAAYPRPDRYLAPEVIATDVAESLERLQVARIGLYFLHRDDPRVPVDEILDALNTEVCRGRIRYLGASNWSVARLQEANACALQWGWQGFVISQVQWSLAVPNWAPGPDPVMRFVSDEDAAWYAAAGLPVVAYSASACGYFADERSGAPTFDSPTNHERRARARELASQLGCTPVQVALAYLMHQDSRVIPAFSTSNVEHLAEVLGSLAVTLSPAQVRWLREG
ncbi:MAG: aldo/keto reductase [Armatimonadetes bacterium]|nr:aldo/keto reductase [Armatimonadota bacterium]